MVTRLIFVLIPFFISMPSFAIDNLGQCTFPDGLKNGINMTQYQTCMAKIDKCQKNGPYLDNTCVQQTVTKEADCKELGQLAKQMSASPELIHIKNVAGFSVIDMAFPADNGHQYAILSPQGCFIDTVIDPRDLSPLVQSEYGKYDFYLEAKSPLQYVKEENGDHNFTIEILAKNQCRACEVLGSGIISFDFDKNNKWVHTELLSFDKLS